DPQPQPVKGSMHSQSLESIRATRRIEATDRWKKRTEEPLVPTNGQDQYTHHERRSVLCHRPALPFSGRIGAAAFLCSARTPPTGCAFRSHHRGDRALELRVQFLGPRSGGTGFGAHYKQTTVWQIAQPRPHHVPQSTLDPIAYHRSPDGLAHDEPHTRRIGLCLGGGLWSKVDNPESTSTRTTSRTHHCVELGAVTHPVLRRQHERYLRVLFSHDKGTGRQGGRTGPEELGSECQWVTLRALRPLRRREAMMARPARVRMRSRKPWTFARRRLFG